jgi:glycosyltransferase involved in cell wall biosynthesis
MVRAGRQPLVPRVCACAALAAHVRALVVDLDGARGGSSDADSLTCGSSTRLDHAGSTFDPVTIDGGDRWRVALVSPVGAAGGGERVLMELARGLRDLGHTVKVLCLRSGAWSDGVWGDDVEIVAYFPGYRLRRPWSVWGAIRWLRRELMEFRPDVVHANHAAWAWTAIATRGLGATTVWHVHDYPDRRDIPTRIGEWLAPDGMLCTTQRVASGYQGRVKKPFAVVSPVTIDASTLSSGQRAISSGKPYVLTVSRWQQHKGLHHIPSVLSELAQRSPRCRALEWVVVGRASDATQKKYREAVLARAADHAVAERLRLVEDCSDVELDSFYRCADCLVHLASSEGFGLAIVEALLRRTAVIACDAPGPVEVLDGGKAGLLVARDDPGAMAEAIASLIDNPERIDELRASAEQRSRDFSRGRMIDDTSRFYGSIRGTGAAKASGSA